MAKVAIFTFAAVVAFVVFDVVLAVVSFVFVVFNKNNI